MAKRHYYVTPEKLREIVSEKLGIISAIKSHARDPMIATIISSDDEARLKATIIQLRGEISQIVLDFMKDYWATDENA